MNVEQKIAFINRALERDMYGEDFKNLWRSLMKSIHHLDSIINDINSYQASTIGIDQAHIEYAKKTVSESINPVFHTLTTRYKVGCNELHGRYDRLVKAISKYSFKNAYRRYHKTVTNLGYFEEHEINASNTPDLHIHAVFDRPSHVSNRDFNRELRSVWYNESGFVYIQNIRAAENDAEAVSSYLTKSKTKGSFLTLHNSYITY